MSKQVKVHNIYEISWPQACAKCGDTHQLVHSHTLHNKLTRKIVKADPQLEYCVCEEHAKWLPLAHLAIDSCGTMTLLRLTTYLATALLILFLGTLPFRLMSHDLNEITVPYVLVIFVAYLGFDYFLRKQLPVKKTKISAKTYILTFENHDFAENFVMQNQTRTVLERLD